MKCHRPLLRDYRFGLVLWYWGRLRPRCLFWKKPMLIGQAKIIISRRRAFVMCWVRVMVVGGMC